MTISVVRYLLRFVCSLKELALTPRNPITSEDVDRDHTLTLEFYNEICWWKQRFGSYLFTSAWVSSVYRIPQCIKIKMSLITPQHKPKQCVIQCQQGTIKLMFYAHAYHRVKITEGFNTQFLFVFTVFVKTWCTNNITTIYLIFFLDYRCLCQSKSHVRWQ